MTDTRLPDSTLFVGRTKTGKSQAIADMILAKHPEAKVLWLAFDNTKVFKSHPELQERWDVRSMSSWKQFEALKDALVQGKEEFDVIVLDGIAALARLCIDDIAPNSGMSQPQWGVMSAKVHRAVRALRDVCDVFASVVLKDTDYSKQGERPDFIVEYDLNQDLQKRVVPEFDTLLYCHYEDGQAEDGSALREYFALETSAFAFQYVQA